MRHYATITTEDQPAMRARLHKLSAHEAVVATNEYLPRESHCELAFRASAEKVHIVANCKVTEVVHSSRGFLLFLRVLGLPKPA